MASNGDNSIAALYLELGLDISQLESDFLAADQTVQRNLNRIRNEDTLIRLRTEVEINGLDEAADATRILEVREQALNRQMELQRDRIRLTAAALQDLTNRRGENSAETQRMAIRLEHERLALQRLEEQLNQVNAAQENLNRASEEIDFGGFDDLASGVLERIPPQVKAVGAAVIGVGTAMTAAGAATKELIEDWRELQQQAYELNMSVNDTENFLRHMRLAGGDIGDFEGFIRGISDAMVKGEWDDPEAMVFRKYGETAFDVNGRIKDFQALTESVKRMFDKAKVAGEEIEFLQLLGGESGVRDAIQYLERWQEATEDAAKISDAGLDPVEMHETERALNLLTEQIGEFKDAAVNLITPATTQAMKGLFEVFRAGTEILSDNKDKLQEWTSAFVKAAAQAIGGNALTSLLFREDPNELDAHTKQVLKAQEDLNRQYAAQKAHLEGDPTTQYGWQRLNDLKDEIADVNAEIEHFNQDYDLSIAQLELWRERALRQNDLSKKEQQAIEEDFSAKLEQIEQERADKLEEIRDEVEAHFKTSIQNQIDAIDKKRDDWISAGMEEAEATVLAERLKADAIVTLNEEAVAKLGAIYQTSLEQRLAQIEREKQAWIQKGVDEVKATQWAEQAKVDAQRDAAMSVLKSQVEEYRAFREGGYEGLQRHQREKLYEAGITSYDLHMTPQQLAAFEKARDVAQRSLLPNFMTAYDRAEDARLRGNQYVDEQGKLAIALDKFERMNSGDSNAILDSDDVKRLLAMPEMSRDYLIPQDKLDAMYQPVNQTAEEFQTLVPQLQGVNESLDKAKNAMVDFSSVEPPALPETPAFELPKTPEMSIDLSEIQSVLGDLTSPLEEFSGQIEQATSNVLDLNDALQNLTGVDIPQVEPANIEIPPIEIDTSHIYSAFEELVSPMQEVNVHFAGLTNQLIDVTSRLSDFIGALNQFSAPQQNQSDNRQTVSVPQNITVTVQIEEAHAWDSQHIQELADRVANVIEPELVRAIGGDSNGY